MELYSRGAEFVIRAGGRELMASRAFRSELHLAELGVRAMSPRPSPCVLVGGMGLGFTLKAALSQVGPAASVVVSEFVPSVVTWNKGVLGHLAEHPLNDPRVSVELGDIVDLIKRKTSAYDVILLDVDNGPGAFTQGSNGWLYSKVGLRGLRRALRREGVLAIWSAGSDPVFSKQMKAAGFTCEEHSVATHRAGRGKRHTIWVGVRTSGEE